MVPSPGRTQPLVSRLWNGLGCSLTILAPWGQTLDETLEQVWRQLDHAERLKVWAAFDMGGEGR